MVEKRSRKQRRIRIKTPAGRHVIHYEPRRKSAARCSSCSTQLHGVVHSRSLAATKRNPSRPYSGVLCSPCMRSTIKNLVVR